MIDVAPRRRAHETDACGADDEGFRTSDPAHNLNNYFQRSTTVLAPKFPALGFVQLHGFDQASRDPHFIISNGTCSTPSERPSTRVTRCCW